MLSSRRPEKLLRRRLHSRIKELTKVSEKHLDAGSNVAVDDENDEPLTFGQRAVLRIRGRVQVPLLVSLHEAHKSSSVLGSELIAMANQKMQLTGSPNPTHEQEDARNKHQIINRCAIRSILEE